MPRNRIVTPFQTGSKHIAAKLTEEDVKVIKHLLRQKGITQLEISQRFNVSYSTIKAISQGLTWKHVEVN